ncbi:MAG TPA: sigma 54-interacting transcriptional regulator [Savagea sp.]
MRINDSKALLTNFLMYKKTPTHLLPHYQSFLQDGEEWKRLQSEDGKVSLYTTPCLSTPYQEQELMIAFQQDEYVLLTEDDQVIGYFEKEHYFTTFHQLAREQLAFYQTMLDTTQESWTMIDEQAHVVGWTKGAEEIFSIKKEEILGKPILQFFNQDELEIFNALHQGESVVKKLHRARRDRTVLISSNPVRLDEKIIGGVVTEVDITNEVRLNEELFSTQEKLFHLENQIESKSHKDRAFLPLRGNSQPLKETIAMTKKASQTEANILIYGESGVGKELFAKAIHYLREDDEAPFIPINCGAIAHNLFESEIFGYEKGAFSGADSRGKAGKAELAQDGTLFLDEVGELPLDLQVKLLRVLQEKKFFRVGGTKEIKVNFRLVAATNKDLKQLVEEGKFREDLYYRLNVFQIEVPPIRERPDDILELANYFVYEYSAKYNKQIQSIPHEIIQCLISHDWKGNVRELKNSIERLVVLSEEGVLSFNDLPPEVKGADKSQPTNTGQTLAEQLEAYERDIILSTLEQVNYQKSECAKSLGVSRATLYNRMNKLGIQ